MPNVAESTTSNMPVVSLLTTPYAWLSRLLTPCDDYWTWMTNDGSIYEEVEVMKIAGETVTFRHKYGANSVPISNLSVELQEALREKGDFVEETEFRLGTATPSFVLQSLSKAG